jgi:hypothetical protein
MTRFKITLIILCIILTTVGVVLFLLGRNEEAMFEHLGLVFFGLLLISIILFIQSSTISVKLLVWIKILME